MHYMSICSNRAQLIAVVLRNVAVSVCGFFCLLGVIAPLGSPIEYFAECCAWISMGSIFGLTLAYVYFEPS